MASKRYTTLVICLLVYFLGMAQATKRPVFEVVHETDSLLQVHFQWDGDIRLVPDSGHYCRLIHKSLFFSTDRTGTPDLPTLSTLVSLPRGSSLTVEAVDTCNILWENVIDKNHRLVPVVEGWAKDSSWPGYHPDEKIYGTDTSYLGGEPFEAENLGIMGNHQLFRLTVRPVAYNPVSGNLFIIKTINARVSLKSPLPSSHHTLLSQPRLLIVSRPEFEAELQPFVMWKRQEGYAVEELYAETHRRDSIRELIRPFFERSNPLLPIPDYLLIVGDAAQIQSFSGETTLQGEGHTTDLFYAEFTGDYLPDAMMGRWPVNDTAELHTVVEKTLRYEQFKEMDTLQLKRMLLVAGEEQTPPAPVTTNAQVNYVGKEVKVAHPEIDTVCYRNPQSGDQLGAIQSAIGQGAGVLNYTAHCTVGGWTSPALTADRVEEAQATQPMVYINNCCKSNIFSGTGFGEQLLRIPMGGAVGVIGATNSTLWNEDYYWAVGPKTPISLSPSYDSLARGAFDALVGRQPSVFTLGEMLTAGNLAVTEHGTSYSRFYWEIYCLLGDPTLRPCIGVPQPIGLTVADTIVDGQSSLSVAATAGATVTVAQGGEVIGIAVADTRGTATVNLRRTLDTLPIVLTASGAGLWPQIDTLTVAHASGYTATLREVESSETLVHFTVENIGTETIDSLCVQLVQTATDSLAGAWIATQGITLHQLQSGERWSDSIRVSLVESGTLPLWQGHLQVVNAERGMMCNLAVCQPLAIPHPTLVLKLADANGHEVRRVRPNRSYQLVAAVEGSYDTLQLEVEEAPFGNHRSSTGTSLEFTTADSLCALAIGGSIKKGHWVEQQHFWIEPGDRTEGFEYGFTSHPWRHDSHEAWTLDSTVSRSGRYSARSGAIGDGEASWLCLEVEMMIRDTISYWVKTSTENSYDKLIFSVDGRDFIPEAWGITDWSQRAHLLEAGHHTLCWRYLKDASDSRGEDCVWIDDLQIPLALWDTTYNWDCLTTPVDIGPQASQGPATTLFPNPAAEQVWLNGPQGTAVRISDALGRAVTSFVLNGETAVLWDTSSLPAGVYFAITTHEGLQNTQKIILIKH